MNKISSLVVFLLIVFIAAGAGGFFTSSSIPNWYVTLKKPSFNPPGWIFGPVWTFLYICIAVSGWLVWIERGNKNIKPVIICFAVQMFFNAIWSPLFFGLNKPGWSFIDICFLWVSILIFIILSWRVSLISALLFIPYWLWVSFASVLNFSIWWLNK